MIVTASRSFCGCDLMELPGMRIASRLRSRSDAVITVISARSGPGGPGPGAWDAERDLRRDGRLSARCFIERSLPLA